MSFDDWRMKAVAMRLTCWWSWLANEVTVTSYDALPAVATSAGIVG